MSSLGLDARAIEEVDKANASGLPLIICLIATKACYIKFSGLVAALAQSNFPFLAIESGQHYESELTAAADELDYRQHLSGYFHIRGDLSHKSASLFTTLSELDSKLTTLGLRSPPLLAICGDTLTAGISPFAWYLITGNRSIHIESGLRSMRPKWEWMNNYIQQRVMPWERAPTRPFPEGLCTRIATSASQQLMAPVQRNVDNLLSESYHPDSIYLSGSPSVDALTAVKSKCIPETGRRLRVDIHRRENLTRSRLSIIFAGLCDLVSQGIPIEFVISKSMQACRGVSWDKDDIHRLESNGVATSKQWESYIRVISFLISPDCIGVYTDSGGLQEETCILGVPCMTCRFDTDRPETVLDFQTNILIPPIDSGYISSSIGHCLSANPKEIWPGIASSSACYGQNVGQTIVSHLRSITVEPSNSMVLR